MPPGAENAQVRVSAGLWRGPALTGGTSGLTKSGAVPDKNRPLPERLQPCGFS